MRSLAVLLLGIHLAFAGTHSLFYFGTAVYRDKNMEKYTSSGMIDDEQFLYFDSNIMKTTPRTEWIKQNEGEEYWNRITQNSISYYHTYKNIMQIIVNQKHQSLSDVDTFQMMFGCELEDDGSTRGYLKFAYDGEDFIILDKDKLSWIAANPIADIIKNKSWTDKPEYWKPYLENGCFVRLTKFVSYSKDRERKVPPEVSLLQRNSSSPVTCHATSFYPKDITMTWMKNNEDVEVSETLPNADGSYQKSISLSVNPEEWKKNPDVYRCVIQHVGAEKEIVVLLNENNIKTNSGSASGIIIAITVGCVMALTVFAAIIGLIVCKKSRVYMKAENAASDAV